MRAIFFPRKDYDVEICTHRLGKKMTYTEQTDSLQLGLSYTPFMTLAKARDIKVGAFVYIYDFSNANIGNAIADYKNEKIWLDLYSLCPSLSEKIIAGQTITELEWNSAYINELLPPYLQKLGKKPVALSYSYGNTTFRDYITQLLGARNSAYNGDTDYGSGYGTPSNKPYSFSRFCSKDGTTRFYDYAKEHSDDFEGSLAIISAKIDETLLNGGWMNNFTHWHNYWETGDEEWAESYLDLLQSKNSNGEIYFAGYGEAVSYLVYRQMITRAVMYSPVKNPNTQLIIRLETNNSLGVDTDLMQVPISVKFSTAGTPLAGMTITSERNLVSLGGGEYIVEIPFDRFPYAIIKKV